MLLAWLERKTGQPVSQLFDLIAGTSTGGILALGLKEGGVDYALDDNNKALVTDEMKAAVEKAKADIIAGTVSVHDYMSDNACPY